jgi:hypothetical protein
MNNDIKVTGIVDHEDGSATVTLDLSPETYHKIFEYGFLKLITRGWIMTFDPTKNRVPYILLWPDEKTYYLLGPWISAICRRQTMGRFRRLMGCGYKQ